jgi:hypothetical protein
MDSKDLGGLLEGEIVHLKPLKATSNIIIILAKSERLREFFSYLVLLLKSMDLLSQ